MSMVRDSVLMVGWRGVSIVTGVGTTVLLAHWLGAEARGEFAILVLWLSLATTVVQLGVPEALIYLVGVRHAGDGVIGSAVAFSVLSSVVAAIAAVPLLLALGIEPRLVLWMVAAGMASVQATYGRHILLGAHQFSWYGAAVVTEGVTNLLALGACAVMGRLTVQTALLSYGVAFTLSSVVSWAAVAHTHRRAASWRPVKLGLVREALHRGGHLFLTGLGGFGIQRLNYLLLEQFAGLRAVGLYAAASTLPNLWANIPQQVATVLYSHASSADSGKSGIRAVSVIHLLACASLLVVVGAIVFATPIVSIAFGPDFSGAEPALRGLALATALTGLNGVLFNVLAGSGLHRVGSTMTLASLVTIAVLGFWWVPASGLMGAVAAQIAGATVASVFIATAYCRHFDMPLSVLLVPSWTQMRRLHHPTPGEDGP